MQSSPSPGWLSSLRVSPNTDTRPPIAPLACRVGLWLILLVALALRLHNLDRSLWYDEILTEKTVQQGLKACIISSVHPLTYVFSFITTHLGTGEAFLRLPSLLFGMLAVWLVYQTGRYIWSPITGLLAAAFLAVSSGHIVYSQEARFYSLLTFAGAFTLHQLLGVIATNQWRYWLGYTASVTFGALSHPFYLPYLAATSAGAAAFVVLINTPDIKSKLKWLANLCLCTVAGLVPFIVIYILHAAQKADLAPMASASTALFRLKPMEYLGYLSALLFNFSAEVIILFAMFTVAGLAFLFAKNRSAAILCAAAVLVTPLPLFFVNVAHWYTAKYFIAVLPAMALLAAVGMTALGGLFAARFNRAVPATLLVIFWTVLLTSKDFFSYLEFHAIPIYQMRNWDELANPIKSRMTRDDLIIHYEPASSTAVYTGEKGTSVRWAELNYYLEKANVQGRPSLNPQRYIGVVPVGSGAQPTIKDLYNCLINEPLSTAWVVKSVRFHLHYNRLTQQLLAPLARNVYGDLLVAGRPTANLVVSNATGTSHKAWNAFTDKARHRGRFDVGIFPRVLAGPASANYSLRPTQYRLRNERFLVWKNSMPVGWTIIGGSKDVINVADPTSSSGARLAIHRDAVGLQQQIDVPLAPGQNVKVTAQVSGDSHTQVELYLQYATPAGVQEATTTQSAGQLKNNLVLTTPVPANASSTSMTVGIRASAPDPATLELHRLHMEIVQPCRLLEPESMYTLSAFLKYDGIQPRRSTKAGEPVPDKNTCGFIALTGKTVNGKSFQKTLELFDGNSDWRPIALQLRPANDPELAEAIELNLQIGIAGDQGTLWVDAVQVERGEIATPYTHDERLPHDEALAIARQKISSAATDASANKH